MAINASNRSLSPVPDGLRRGSAAGELGSDGLAEDDPPAGIPSMSVRSDSGAQARSEHSEVPVVDNDAAEEAQTIYERDYGPWRYELPDEYRETTTPSKAQDDSKTVRNMALSWEEYDKFPKIVDVWQDNVASRPKTEKEVTWLHVQEPSLDLKAMENRLSQEDLALRKRELYLGQHLLKRVEDEAQRPYPTGLSCKPIALTYHSRDPTKRTPDGTASFICFPYFLLADQEPAKTRPVNKKVHPTRTLLQYQFPLETSKVRDRDCQSVRNLNVGTLKGHVSAYTPRQGETDETRVSQIFHVPQLWCVTIGSGKILTYGSIAGSDLSALSVEIEQKPPCTNSVYRPAVRFNFRHGEIPQELTFAIEECHSAYGLRNKKNQILRCRKIKKDDRQSYRLQFGEKGGHLIDEKTWPIILRTEEEGRRAPVLDLWMDHHPEKAEIPRDARSSPRALSPIDRSLIQDGQASAGAQTSDAVNPDLANTSRDRQSQAVQDNNIPGIQISEPEREAVNDQSEMHVRFSNGIARTGVSSNSTDHSQRSSASESRGRGSRSAQPKQVADSKIPKGSADEEGNGTTQSSEYVALGNSKWAAYAKMVPPLLYWPIANEDGVVETSTNEERASKILDVTYRRIDKVDPRSNLNTSAQGPLTPGDQELHPDRSTSGVLLKTKEDLTKKFGKGHQGYELFQSLSYLWESFVPETHRPESTSVKYFWGLVSQLLEPEDSQKTPPTIKELYAMSKHVKKIDGLAKAYLLGVYCRDLAREVEHPSDREKTLGFSRHLARGAFLLEATVEASAAIHSMLSAGWLETTDRNITGVPRRFAERAEEAQAYLSIAMSRTRADLNRTTHDRLVGPIMTPETVLIKVLNALTKGVFGKGNVNIIEIYDGRLQELLKETRDRRPTRHLLAEISDYQEQLVSVLNVLDQQHRVLQQLRTNLDPALYTSSSVSRRIQFEYEARALDEIEKLVKSQRADCAVFQERAKQLALQLLQKVEAFQDDNQKAILVFTLFTVFFLPLSFVTGFYGMNLTHFPPEDENIRQFWVVAVPTTGVITIIALVVLFRDSLERMRQRLFSTID